MEEIVVIRSAAGTYVVPGKELWKRTEMKELQRRKVMLYIARGNDGMLTLHTKKPELVSDTRAPKLENGEVLTRWHTPIGGHAMVLPSTLFKRVKECQCRMVTVRLK